MIGVFFLLLKKFFLIKDDDEPETAEGDPKLIKEENDDNGAKTPEPEADVKASVKKEDGDS